MGAYVSLGGALLTIGLNIVFIPTYGYMASAWATLACYGSMALVSYILGQKFYPVEYDLKSFLKYFFIALLVYFSYTQTNEHLAIAKQLPPFVLSSLYMLIFFVFVWFEDGRKLVKRSTSL